MKRLKDNLLLQFSISSFVIMAIIAVSVSTLISNKLDLQITALQEHAAQMAAFVEHEMGEGHAMEGFIPEDATFSIPGLVQQSQDLQRITLVSIGIGFLILYATVVSIVWNGWRTINRQQATILSANQALTEADRVKGELIQNISHEFRTPLTYLVGYLGLILDQEQGMGPLTDDQEQALKIVSSQSEKLSRRVEVFVALHTTKRFSPNGKGVDISDLLEETVTSAMLVAKDLQLSLVLDIEPALPLAKANKIAIGQVVDNLVGNAIKFTPPGGEINIRAWVESADQKIHLAVKDTGIGISEEVDNRIFERFYQVDGAPSREYSGLGLGLSLCNEIMGAHGERIWVDRNPDKGTTFTITMAIDDRSSPSKETL